MRSIVLAFLLLSARGGVAALAAVAVGLGHGQTVHAGGREGLLDIVELMGLNDSGDQLHFTSPP